MGVLSLSLFLIVTCFTCKSVAGHRFHEKWRWNDWHYDKCEQTSYCTTYHDECTSDEGWHVRCQKCSIFQTCMKDAKNMMDDCDDVYVCKDIEPFKQGAGTFAFLILMAVSTIVLLVISCCMYRKATNFEQKVQKANLQPTKHTISSVYPVVTPGASRVYSEPPPNYEEYVGNGHLTMFLPNAPVLPNSTELPKQNRLVHNTPPSYTTGKLPSTLKVQIDKDDLRG